MRQEPCTSTRHAARWRAVGASEDCQLTAARCRNDCRARSSLPPRGRSLCRQPAPKLSLELVAAPCRDDCLAAGGGGRKGRGVRGGTRYPYRGGEGEGVGGETTRAPSHLGHRDCGISRRLKIGVGGGSEPSLTLDTVTAARFLDTAICMSASSGVMPLTSLATRFTFLGL